MYHTNTYMHKCKILEQTITGLCKSIGDDSYIFIFPYGKILKPIYIPLLTHMHIC